MMREFRGPETLAIFKVIGAVVSVASSVSGLFGGKPKGATQQVKSADQESAEEAAAKAEAERKQAAEDKSRQGRRRTLVVPPTEGALSSDVASKRRTLLGGTGTV